MDENNIVSVGPAELIKGIKELGIEEWDTIIVHSSMKSFGRFEGGPGAVISALCECVKQGTLCFPALRLHDLGYTRSPWSVKGTPSDTGLLSETFRTTPGVLRSDQPTHSVCALGRNAEFITSGHMNGPARRSVFGDFAFCYSSPWQKIYDLGGKVIMIGVTMVYNTFKHFVECKLVGDILRALPAAEAERAGEELSRFEDLAADPNSPPPGVWLWHDGARTQSEMERAGLVKAVTVGKSRLISFKVRDFVAFMYLRLRTAPEDWLSPAAAAWLRKYDKI